MPLDRSSSSIQTGTSWRTSSGSGLSSAGPKLLTSKRVGTERVSQSVIEGNRTEDPGGAGGRQKETNLKSGGKGRPEGRTPPSSRSSSKKGWAIARRAVSLWPGVYWRSCSTSEMALASAVSTDGRRR